MRVCGVELKGKEAIICLLSIDDGLFELPECRARKIDLSDVNSTEALQQFQFAFGKLMQDYSVDKVVIRQRPQKGKFAGGAPGFKMEAALQLLATPANTARKESTESAEGAEGAKSAKGLKVSLISNSAIKTINDRNPLTIDFRETGLKQFQRPAFDSAYALVMAELHDLDPDNLPTADDKAPKESQPGNESKEQTPVQPETQHAEKPAKPTKSARSGKPARRPADKKRAAAPAKPGKSDRSKKTDSPWGS